MKNVRKIVDAALEVSKALPAAGAAASTAAIDLETSSGCPCDVQLNVAVPATPALAAAKKITVMVEDSANGVDFAATGYSFAVAGVADEGGPATEHNICLGPEVRQFVRVTAAVDADGGDNTAVAITAGLRF